MEVFNRNKLNRKLIPAEEGTSLSNDAPGYYGDNNSLNNGDDEYSPVKKFHHQ